jgi:hypothetical protein
MDSAHKRVLKDVFSDRSVANVHHYFAVNFRFVALQQFVERCFFTAVVSYYQLLV